MISDGLITVRITSGPRAVTGVAGGGARSGGGGGGRRSRFGVHVAES